MSESQKGSFQLRTQKARRDAGKRRDESYRTAWDALRLLPVSELQLLQSFVSFRLAEINKSRPHIPTHHPDEEVLRQGLSSDEVEAMIYSSRSTSVYSYWQSTIRYLLGYWEQHEAYPPGSHELEPDESLEYRRKIELMAQLDFTKYSTQTQVWEAAAALDIAVAYTPGALRKDLLDRNWKERGLVSGRVQGRGGVKKIKHLVDREMNRLGLDK